MRVACITVDCSDPVSFVEFWAAALAWTVTARDDTGASCEPSDGGPGLEFMRVSEVKTVKNRVHLEIHCDDLNAEIVRLTSLGSTLAWEEEFPEGWPYRNVVRDPEGNEFCIGDEP